MPENPVHPHRAAVREAAQSAVAAGRIPKTYADFRLAVLDATSSAPSSVAPPSPSFDTAVAEEHLRSGRPLLHCAGALRIPDGLFESVKAVAAVMSAFGIEGGTDMAEGLSGAGAVQAVHEAAYALFSRDSTAFESAAEKADSPPSLLRFAITSALHPFLGRAASELRPAIRQDLWMRGYCPVCGIEPVAARIVRDPPGARVMHCGGCGFEWRAARAACPFCENSEAGTIRVLTADFQSPERASACDKCFRYVKEIDERKMVEGLTANLAAFDVVSLDLDMEAERAGYGPAAR